MGEAQLPGRIFDVPLRRDIVHRVVIWQLAKRRQGTAKTKDRAEVSGTTRKMSPQKGQVRRGTGAIATSVAGNRRRETLYWVRLTHPPTRKCRAAHATATAAHRSSARAAWRMDLAPATITTRSPRRPALAPPPRPRKKNGLNARPLMMSQLY